MTLLVKTQRLKDVRGFAQGHRINPSIYSSKRWTAVEPDSAEGEMGHSLLEASCLNQELLYDSVLIRTYLLCLQQGHRGLTQRENQGRLLGGGKTE